MKRKIDSLTGKRIYQRRLATVEPVFANIRAAKGLDRFTLRGKTKVNSQWLLYCLVHNLGKDQRYGPALAVSGFEEKQETATAAKLVRAITKTPVSGTAHRSNKHHIESGILLKGFFYSLVRAHQDQNRGCS